MPNLFGNTGTNAYGDPLAAQPFDGATVEPQDVPRLSLCLERVRSLMSDGRWRTLAEVAASCECSEAGASARLRDLRKEKFGGHRVDRRRRSAGVWEYMVEAI